MRLIVLPLALVLDAPVLIDLKSASFLLAQHPLSPIEISVAIEHRSIAVRLFVEFLPLIAILPDFGCDPESGLQLVIPCFTLFLSAGGALRWILDYPLGRDGHYAPPFLGRLVN